jgi:hypothetical protein
LRDFVEDALANRGGVVSLVMKAGASQPGLSAHVGWGAKDIGYYPTWHLDVEYGLAGPDPGRREVEERELAFDNLRGVRPARGARGVGGVRGVAPRRVRC